MVHYGRNVMVGVVVSAALVILVWMVIVFGDSPARLIAPRTYPIAFVATQAEGLGEGSNVLFRGVVVGRVTKVMLSPDGRTVRIMAAIEEAIPVPASVTAAIRFTGLIGGVSAIHLVPDGGKSEGKLVDVKEMNAVYSGLDFLPPEFSELATELRSLSGQLRQSNIVGESVAAVKAVKSAVDKAGVLMDSIQSVMGDAAVQTDLKTAIAEFKEASKSAAALTAKLDAFAANDLPKLSEQAQGVLTEAQGAIADGKATVNEARTQINEIGDSLSKRLDELAVAMESVKSIAGKIDEGKGTAGQLVNDPRLYQSIVDATRQLNGTLADLNRLVKQWEQEGVRLKLR